MMKNKPQQAANISEDELTCNSYNTTEEEDDDNKKDSLYKIQLRKEKMHKFFIENPYLEGQLDLNGDDGGQKGRGFAEDDNGMINNSMKYWESISKEVDSTYNIKKKTKAKTLDQIMKRINIFKSRLDTLDRNPILKKILEKDSRENSANKMKDEDEKKDKNEGQQEFVYYSFRKKMQAEYQKLIKDKQTTKKEETAQDASKSKKPTKSVHSRLANTKKNENEESTIKIDENLKIKYDTGKKLYQELSKAKNEKEYKAIAREHWMKFKTNYKKSLADLKSHQFIQNFVKENKKYNIYLPDFNKEKKKTMNKDEEKLREMQGEDESKQKELMGEDEEIFTMIDKIMSGAVYEKWRSLQDKDL